MRDDRLYFRQLLSGRDFARDDPLASQMVNFAYLIGDRDRGETVVLEGCGRTDFPGSDAGQMYDSLQRLASLPGDVVVYPGHRYSMPSSATMDAIKDMNYVYRPSSKEQWLAMFGA